MGWQLVDAIFDTELTPTQKLVLMAVCRRGPKDGTEQFASVRTLMGWTGYSEPTIRRALRQLRHLGYLVADGQTEGGSRPTTYRVEMTPTPITVIGVSERQGGAITLIGVYKEIESEENQDLNLNVLPSKPEWLRELIEDFEGPPVKVTVEKALEYQASKGLTDDRCAETVTGMMSKISWNEKAKHYELAKSGTGRATAYKNLWAVFRTWVARPQQALSNGYQSSGPLTSNDSNKYRLLAEQKAERERNR